MHSPDTECFVGPFEEDVEPGPLNLPVEDEPDRPIFRLVARGDNVEGSVAEPLARAR